MEDEAALRESLHNLHPKEELSGVLGT